MTTNQHPPPEGLAARGRPGFPRLSQLGHDLCRITAWQRVGVVGRPFLVFIAYWWMATWAGWWWAVPVLAALQFVSYGSSSHDYVHRTLGLKPIWNEILLAVTEGICLRSGHAYRCTHLRHHQNFPGDDDPEAAGAATTFWRAAWRGPGNQVRLYLHAWRQVTPRDQWWMAAEALVVLGWWVAALIFWRTRPAVAVYVLAMTCGGWLLPLATVWWPHRNPGPGETEHTRVFRGRWLPALMLHHTYHFEHHLYPAVPSVNWRELGRRLDPYILAAGVPVYRLP